VIIILMIPLNQNSLFVVKCVRHSLRPLLISFVIVASILILSVICLSISFNTSIILVLLAHCFGHSLS